MDRALLVQRLRQLASNNILNKQISATLDCAANIIEFGTKTAEVEIEYSDISCWYVCGECRSTLNPPPKQKYCSECGRRLIWK